MAISNIKAYMAVVFRQNKRTVTVGSTSVPVEVSGVNTSEGHCAGPYDVIVPAGSSAILFDGTATGSIRDWAVLTVQIEAGTLELLWFCDTPTSESNLAASGGNPVTIPDSMSCAVMKAYDNTRIRGNSDKTKAFGVSGTTPNILSNEGTNVLLKRYILRAWNRGTSDVVASVAVMD